MKLMIHLALVASLLAALLLLTTMPAAACSCAGGLPFIHHVTNADAIFTGKVAAQEPATTPTSYGAYLMLSTIEVAKMWKGSNQPTILVAGGEGAGCGFGLELGKEYLLFVSKSEGNLYASLCTLNQLLATADHNIALLDQMFSDLAAPPSHPAATVTVLGTTTYPMQADQLSVRFVMAEPATDASGATDWAALEQEQAQLQDFLRSEQTLTSLLGEFTLSTNGRDFSLTIKRDTLSDDDLLALLDQLTKIETTLSNDEQLPLRAIEVMFSVSDCTLSLVTAHRSAMWNARERAGLLATVMGNAVDTVQTIIEEPTDSLSADGGDVCQALRWRQWHELPLTTDLATVLTIEMPIKLRVTFGLKPAIVQETPTVASPFVSPLPTPTP